MTKLTDAHSCHSRNTDSLKKIFNFNIKNQTEVIKEEELCLKYNGNVPTQFH